MGIQLFCEMDEKELKSLILRELKARLGEDAGLTIEAIKIEVKSKQNYKSEWEVADFRASYQGTI